MAAAEQIGLARAALRTGVPFADYLALDAEHFSSLKHLETSPLEYQHQRSRPHRDTRAMRIGRLAHAAILTPNIAPEKPEPFGGEHVAIYDGIRNGKKWNAFKEENSARRIVTVNELEAETDAILAAADTAEAMRAGVRRNSEAMDLLASGAPEVTLTWTHARTGVRLKTRPDWLGSGIVEVKTTVRFSKSAFDIEFRRRLYFVQLAIQSAGILACTGELMPAKMLVAQNCAPFDVAVCPVDDASMAAGAQRFEQWIDLIDRCQKRDEWPGIGGWTLTIPDFMLSAPVLSLDGVDLDDAF